MEPSSVLVWLRQTILAGIKSFKYFLSFLVIRFFETTVQKWCVFFCWLWNKVRIPTPEPWQNESNIPYCLNLPLSRGPVEWHSFSIQKDCLRFNCTRMQDRVGSPTLSCQLRKEMAKITVALKKRNRKFHFTSFSGGVLLPLSKLENCWMDSLPPIPTTAVALCCHFLSVVRIG